VIEAANPLGKGDFEEVLTEEVTSKKGTGTKFPTGQVKPQKRKIAGKRRRREGRERNPEKGLEMRRKRTSDCQKPGRH